MPSLRTFVSDLPFLISIGAYVVEIALIQLFQVKHRVVGFFHFPNQLVQPDLDCL